MDYLKKIAKEKDKTSKHYLTNNVQAFELSFNTYYPALDVFMANILVNIIYFSLLIKNFSLLKKI